MLSSITMLIIIVGLVQLPILTDLLIFVFPSSPLPRLASRATAPIFVLLFLACCALALQLFFGTFLPLSLDALAPLSAASAVALTVALSCLALYIIGNMLYYYCLAAFTAASPAVAAPSDPRSAACRRCGAAKGPRVHHCRICDRCTLLLDHHCPFTSNCVGSSTMRPFYLWLTFCLVGLLYGAAMSWTAFARCIVQRSVLPAESTGGFTFVSELLPASLSAAFPQASSAIPAVFWSRALCKSLSNAPWTFLLVAFGLAPVLALWAGQTALLHCDRTTIEVIAAFGNAGSRRAATAETDGGEAGKGQLQGGEAALAQRPRKSWAMIHRHEPLYRLLAPDPLWRILAGRKAKDRR